MHLLSLPLCLSLTNEATDLHGLCEGITYYSYDQCDYDRDEPSCKNNTPRDSGIICNEGPLVQEYAAHKRRQKQTLLLIW